MSAYVFDTYLIAKRLKAAGFSEEQTEALIEAARDALQGLATKQDSERLERKREQTRTDLAKDLTIHFGVMLAAAAGINVGFLRLPLGG